MEDYDRRKKQIMDSEKMAFVAGLIAIVSFVIYAVRQNW